MMLTIRDMHKDDVVELVLLTQHLGYEMSIENMTDRVKLFLNNPYGKVLVAEIESTIVGYVCIWIREHFHDMQRSARIMALVVHAQHRRTGIGKKLIVAAEQYVRNVGCISLDLTSSHKRIAAHFFYTNLGYQSEAKRYFTKMM